MRRSLFIGAHLDDIELAAGGTVWKLVQAGCEVAFLVLSRSDYASYDGKHFRSADKATEEGTAAATVLGVDRLEVLNFPAKDIENHSLVVEAINEFVDEFQPSIIFTHWPFDTHRSHANTALTSIAAGRRYNSIVMYEPITPAGRSYIGFRPQMYVDIGDSGIEHKLASLRCHVSEYEKYGERWIDGVMARARYRGFEMGATFGEAFEVLRLEVNI